MSTPGTPPPEPRPAPAPGPRRGGAWQRLKNRLRNIRLPLPSLGRSLLLVLLLAVGAGVFLFWRQRDRDYVTTDNAYVVGNITPLSAEVAGQVVALYTDDNMVVRAGDPLLQIDPVPYQVAAAQAAADLAQATADARAGALTEQFTRQDRTALLKRAQAQAAEQEQVVRSAQLDVENKQTLFEKDRKLLDALKAQLPGARALLKNAEFYRDRFGRLAAQGNVSIQARDDKEAAFQDARAKLGALEGSIAAADRQVAASQVLLDEARVKVKQAGEALARTKAALEQARAAQIQPDAAGATARALDAKVRQTAARLRNAQLQLGYTLVRAPQSGIVSRRTVQLGQTLPARQPFLSIVPLDPENVWIVANLREDEMKRVRVGQPVRIHIDALPGQTFTGYVESVAGGTGSAFSLFPPDNATGNFVRVVQRIPVRIRFTNTRDWSNRIRPGMSASVTIDTTQAVRQSDQEW